MKLRIPNSVILYPLQNLLISHLGASLIHLRYLVVHETQSGLWVGLSYLNWPCCSLLLAASQATAYQYPIWYSYSFSFFSLLLSLGLRSDLKHQNWIWFWWVFSSHLRRDCHPSHHPSSQCPSHQGTRCCSIWGQSQSLCPHQNELISDQLKVFSSCLS